MSMVDAMIEEGGQAINALPEHATRIAGLLTTHFPAQTLEAVHKAFRASASGSSINTKVTELSSLLREEAAVAAAQFRACEMWLRLKNPAISDGNNFGVEVQGYVLEQLQTMRTAIEAMTVVGKDYHWARGTGLEKIVGETNKTVSKDEKTSSETKDGKKEDKAETSTDTKTVESSKTPLPDYVEYVVEVDVRHYHLVFNHLTDLRNSYVKAHVLFDRNMKKLKDPRGDGDGKSANVMSMF